MWHIFEKQRVEGYQTETKTKTKTKYRKDYTCGLFSKRREFKDIITNTFKDLQGPSGAFKDLQGPSRTLKDLQGPSRTFKEFQGL